MSTLPDITAPTPQTVLSGYFPDVLTGMIGEFNCASVQDLPLDLISQFLAVPDETPVRQRVWDLEASNGEVRELFQVAHTNLTPAATRIIHNQEAEIEYASSMFGMRD